MATAGVVATPTVNQKPSLASISTDPMRNFKFQVNIYNPLLGSNPAQFGFMSVSGLSLTTDVIVYRTGGMNTTANPLSTLVLTPDGYTKMGDLQVGDALIDPWGEPSEVTGIFPQGVHPVYTVTLEDGSSAECADEHLWLIHVEAPDAPAQLVKTLTMRDILENNSVWLPESVPYGMGEPDEVHAARRVVSVDYARHDEVQCISVSASSHLYVIDDYIPTHNTQKMPGQTDFSPLVLSRGLVAGDTPIWSWFQQIFQVIQGTGGSDNSTDFRSIMDILLIDHPVTTPTATVKAAWRVENCWPISIAFSDMDAGANGLMLQQITMAHEGFLFKVADKAGPGYPATIPVGATS